MTKEMKKTLEMNRWILQNVKPVLHNQLTFQVSYQYSYLNDCWKESESLHNSDNSYYRRNTHINLLPTRVLIGHSSALTFIALLQAAIAARNSFFVNALKRELTRVNFQLQKFLLNTPLANGITDSSFETTLFSGNVCVSGLWPDPLQGSGERAWLCTVLHCAPLCSLHSHTRMHTGNSGITTTSPLLSHLPAGKHCNSCSRITHTFSSIAYCAAHICDSHTQQIEGILR